MTLLALALLLASQLPGPDAREVARAAAEQCGDLKCVADTFVWGHAESGLSRVPKPWSKDAREGLSCGVLQTPCASTPRDVAGQVRVWLRMRAQSLAACGDLTGLASGTCGRATRLVQAREQEAAGWLYLAQWQEMP